MIGNKGHFTLGIRTKNKEIRPKGFTLGVMTILCENDLALIWHHFGAKGAPKERSAMESGLIITRIVVRS